MRDSEKRGASRNRAAGRRGFLPRGVRTRKRPLSIAVPEIAPIDERPPYAGIGVEFDEDIGDRVLGDARALAALGYHWQPDFEHGDAGDYDIAHVSVPPIPFFVTRH